MYSSVDKRSSDHPHLFLRVSKSPRYEKTRDTSFLEGYNFKLPAVISPPSGNVDETVLGKYLNLFTLYSLSALEVEKLIPPYEKIY